MCQQDVITYSKSVWMCQRGVIAYSKSVCLPRQHIPICLWRVLSIDDAGVRSGSDRPQRRSPANMSRTGTSAVADFRSSIAVPADARAARRDSAFNARLAAAALSLGGLQPALRCAVQNARAAWDGLRDP